MDSIYDRFLFAIEEDRKQSKRKEPKREEHRLFVEKTVKTMKEMSNMKDRKWKSTYRRCLRSLHSAKLHAKIIPKSVESRALNRTAYVEFVDEAEKWLDTHYILEDE